MRLPTVASAKPAFGSPSGLASRDTADGFTQNPVTTIASGTTNSYVPAGGQFPSIYLLVDGTPTSTPTNSFTDTSFPNTNAAWTAGSWWKNCAPARPP